MKKVTAQITEFEQSKVHRDLRKLFDETFPVSECDFSEKHDAIILFFEKHYTPKSWIIEAFEVGIKRLKS